MNVRNDTWLKAESELVALARKHSKEADSAKKGKLADQIARVILDTQPTPPPIVEPTEDEWGNPILPHDHEADADTGYLESDTTKFLSHE